MSNLIKNVLTRNAWIPLNLAIMHFLEDKDAAILISDLINRREYFDRRGELDSEGGFYVLSDVLETELLMGKRARIAAIKLLIEKGLLKVQMKHFTLDGKGTQSVNFFYIQDLAIEEVLKGSNIRVGAKMSPPGVQNAPTNKKASSPPNIISPNFIHTTIPNINTSPPEDIKSTKPTPEVVIQDFLANAGNFDLLKDRLTRQTNLEALVYEFQLAGYSDFDTKYVLNTLVKYAVPPSSKKFNPTTWEADLKTQWEITVKAAYKPAQPAPSDKIYGRTGEVNKESLEANYDELFSLNSKEVRYED